MSARKFKPAHAEKAHQRLQRFAASLKRSSDTATAEHSPPIMKFKGERHSWLIPIRQFLTPTNCLPASQLSSVADLTKKLYQNLDIHNSAGLGAKIRLGEMRLRANLRQQNCGGQDVPGRRPPSAAWRPANGGKIVWCCNSDGGLHPQTGSIWPFWLGLPDLIPEVSFRLRRKIIGLSSRRISRTVETRIIFVALLDPNEPHTIVFMTTEHFT
jgi:hypothetical protein